MTPEQARAEARKLRDSELDHLERVYGKRPDTNQGRAALLREIGELWLAQIARALLAEDRVKELEVEQEKLVWNLGGCSSVALGYCLDVDLRNEWVRPALRDVHKLRLEADRLRAELDKATEGESKRARKRLLNRLMREGSKFAERRQA